MKFRKIMGNATSDIPEVSIQAFHYLCASIEQYGTSQLSLRKGRNRHGEEKVYLVACVDGEYAPVAVLADSVEEVNNLTHVIPADMNPNGPHVVAVETLDRDESTADDVDKFQQVKELVKALRVVKPRGYKEGAGKEYYAGVLHQRPGTLEDPADATLIKLAAIMPSEEFDVILGLFDVLGVEKAKEALRQVKLRESTGETFELMRKILDGLEQLSPEKVKHGLGASYLEEAKKALSPNESQTRLVYLARTLSKDRLGIVLKMYDVMGIEEANGALAEV